VRLSRLPARSVPVRIRASTRRRARAFHQVGLFAGKLAAGQVETDVDHGIRGSEQKVHIRHLKTIYSMGPYHTPRTDA
jgi:hypothetical protein